MLVSFVKIIRRYMDGEMPCIDLGVVTEEVESIGDIDKLSIDENFHVFIPDIETQIRHYLNKKYGL